MLNRSYAPLDSESDVTSSCIHRKDQRYSGMVAIAANPMIHWMMPSARSGSLNRSARLCTQSAPSASPRMNADSMRSNECVALPSTSESRRIHEIS